MASTTALFTGLSGILAHSRMLDVVGNNISNTNTTAYKSSRIQFEPSFSRTFNQGSAPGVNSGGANPTQIGNGVKIAGTSRDFRNGSISATGVKTDLAIEGDGFFVVSSGGQTMYTRAGSFGRNADNDLVTINGGMVQGYAVDDNFDIVNGRLTDINVPVGSLTVAEATSSVRFSGNLNAAGDVAALGSLTEFAALLALGTAVPPPSNPPFADSTTRLVDLDDGAGGAQFTSGDIIRMSGAEKGGKTLDDADLAIDATTTVADLMTFLESALGIDTSVAGAPGGVSIDATTGVLTVEGNYGVDNTINLASGDLTQLDSSGAALGLPFTMTQTQDSDGESVRTTFVVYDSLGTPLDVDLTLVLESTSDTGTTWRYYAESADSVGIDLRLGTGTMNFDTSGVIIPPSTLSISMDRTDTGAENPLVVELSFGEDGESVTSLTDNVSALAAVFQDGSPIGTLSDFSIGEDGVISGAFTNGLIRTIGQIVVATFTNPEGMVDLGDNMFGTGPNSGTPVITEPLTLGAGRVVGGALELSNVDLSQEFINLILAQTGYTASSRVISTTNELIQQLLVLGR